LRAICCRREKYLGAIKEGEWKNWKNYGNNLGNFQCKKKEEERNVSQKKDFVVQNITEDKLLV
jgi:hypothetical protein